MVEENCEVVILGQYSTQAPQLHGLYSVGNKDTLEYPAQAKYKETFQCLHQGWTPTSVTYNSE
jgi:hypothetical protein